LQIPVGEVEPWVVRAVTRGLLDARVDQAAGTLVVTHAVTREFGAAQWTGLQSKLRAWRDNVDLLLVNMGCEGGSGK